MNFVYLYTEATLELQKLGKLEQTLNYKGKVEKLTPFLAGI